MKILNKEIEMLLKEEGAQLVGFADVKHVLPDELSHLSIAICIGLNRMLNKSTIECLEKLQRKLCKYLKTKGFRYLSIPPDSDKKTDKFVSKLYPLFTHKIAATSAGLGWIGKNGLFISKKYGPKVSIATVLTDAYLKPNKPVVKSFCGDCYLCMKYCPANAITGRIWTRDNPFGTFVQIDKCLQYKENIRQTTGKPNCGLCINICPYGRKKTIDNKKRRSTQWQSTR